ncbi:MAG TPA: anti-sigma regulatory factor [Bryobacteraceae bacterium]|jgi:serine/threonine-protein kinase RsbT|nr:anti-sigma regulatory factor [Bryobacteraceae bacterium]
MVVKKVEMRLTAQQDVVAVRQATRSLAVEIGLSIVDQTKVVTAASELARNTVTYGGGGLATLEILTETAKQGLRLTFEDQGPGIPDIDRAMQDGYTSGNGLGLGLGGAKRLSSEFSLHSEPGAGTRVVITRWKG